MAWMGVRWSLAAEGHEHSAGADGGVEPLAEPPLGADVQIPRQGRGRPPAKLRLHLAFGRDWGLRQGLHRCASPRRWSSRNSLDRSTIVLAVPVHHKPGLVRHHAPPDVASRFSWSASWQKALCVLCRNHHGHALLGFADGQLRPVQALILLGDRVQVDVQAVGQLADGDGHAAGAKVVAALDEAGRPPALRNSRWSLRSSGALPFWTSAPQCASDSNVWDLDEPVAPPQPSRPVRPPSRITTSPSPGAAPGGRSLPGRRQSPRRFPCAWPHSRRDTPHRPGPWPGRSGCRRRSSPPRRW